MKIEIWSDIACPFCYIGKAHLEKALASFGHDEAIEIQYKSYQLDPDYHYGEGDTASSVLSKKKGMTEDQIKQMTGRITQMAEQAGVQMNFDINLPANTFDAHRLIHAATKVDLQKEMINALFKAHFTDGKNIESSEVLKTLGLAVGLKEDRIDAVLASEDFAYEVKRDILEARNIGVQGVPFFVFNQKYALSGAQPVATFEEVLEKSFTEWRKDHPVLQSMDSSEGPACSDESCEI